MLSAPAVLKLKVDTLLVVLVSFGERQVDRVAVR
jgi:hypothetical protein